MKELIEKIENDEYQQDDEVLEMPSRNHSFTQARITSLLSNDERFTPFVELSLDVSQTDLTQFGLKIKEEIIPDICLYPNSVGFNDEDDDLKMQDMPLLAIEIISPRQAISDLLAKFKAYFALGVKSCWLIIPPLKTVAVYSQPSHFKTFAMDMTEVIDEVMDIRLPIHKIFSNPKIVNTNT
ncbi:Uma2 family endonuclease [Candidatus Parabeggiatoa sp. HSG14]|uniref:Uma2 family endonuclease n=1 Tax=Candidatus Parabeggiatoa sp. HSG14 TaxID=3055593 RepID=UPI0025A727FD|nr:Uma2 family endonuclease [Thiotrichales bacterium HSG14]